jgi:antitoxin HicB
MKAKSLSHYLSLKYPVSLQESPNGGYFVTHPDLDGCMAEGGTLEEAMANLTDARELWIETRLENGYSVPEPGASSPVEYSGRISLRMAPSLHEQLARIAERRDISLNLLINTVLASYAGGEDALQEAKSALAEMLEQTSPSKAVVARNAAASEKRLRR